jgi:CRISPR-associated Csx3 family protein
MKMTIDVFELYREDTHAKLSQLIKYEGRCLELVSDGAEVVLTGRGPIWLYLRLAHALHGRVRALYYTSPVTGEVEIFNHNPF